MHKRLLPQFLLSLTLLTAACSKEKNDPEPEEPAGLLEGSWKTLSVDPVLYDRQGKVVATYRPIDALGFTHLTITPTNLELHDGVTNARLISPYVRQGDELLCTPPHQSYTIRKLTATKLDLYLIGEDELYGTEQMRHEYTIHLERQ